MNLNDVLTPIKPTQPQAPSAPSLTDVLTPVEPIRGNTGSSPAPAVRTPPPVPDYLTNEAVYGTNPNAQGQNAQALAAAVRGAGSAMGGDYANATSKTVLESIDNLLRGSATWNFAQNLAREQAVTNKMQADHPDASLIGTVAGSMVPAVTSMQAVKGITAAPPFLRTVLGGGLGGGYVNAVRSQIDPEQALAPQIATNAMHGAVGGAETAGALRGIGALANLVPKSTVGNAITGLVGGGTVGALSGGFSHADPVSWMLALGSAAGARALGRFPGAAAPIATALQAYPQTADTARLGHYLQKLTE